MALGMALVLHGVLRTARVICHAVEGVAEPRRGAFSGFAHAADP